MAAAKTRQQTRPASRDEWNARALELAEAHHLTGRARWIGTGLVDEALYQVPSRSAEGSCHVVHIYPRTGQVTCTCLASVWGKPCSHVGSALHAQRQKEEAERTPQNEPLRSFAHGLSW